MRYYAKDSQQNFLGDQMGHFMLWHWSLGDQTKIETQTDRRGIAVPVEVWSAIF